MGNLSNKASHNNRGRLAGQKVYNDYISILKTLIEHQPLTKFECSNIIVAECKSKESEHSIRNSITARWGELKNAGYIIEYKTRTKAGGAHEVLHIFNEAYKNDILKDDQWYYDVREKAKICSYRIRSDHSELFTRLLLKNLIKMKNSGSTNYKKNLEETIRQVKKISKKRIAK